MAEPLSAEAVDHALTSVAESTSTLQQTLQMSQELVAAVLRTVQQHGEQTALAALSTAPMLTQLRAGSQWNLDMASRGAATEEIEGACVLRFPRKPGNRCEVTFVAGDVEITTRH